MVTMAATLRRNSSAENRNASHVLDTVKEIPLPFVTNLPIHVSAEAKIEGG